MSIDFIGLFDVNTPGVNPSWLSASLAKNPPVWLEVVERYRRFWRVQDWEVEARPDRAAVLLGPGGFEFHFRPRIVVAYHMIHFRRFTCNAEEQSALRRVWRFLSDFLGSSQAIYTHELMPYEGDTLSEIEAHLRAEFGPPSPGWAELCAADDFGPGAWYIDDFADLRGSESEWRARGIDCLSND